MFMEYKEDPVQSLTKENNKAIMFIFFLML